MRLSCQSNVSFYTIYYLSHKKSTYFKPFVYTRVVSNSDERYFCITQVFLTTVVGATVSFACTFSVNLPPMLCYGFLCVHFKTNLSANFN